MRRRIFWLVVGLILAGLAYVTFSGSLDPPVEPLPADVKKILIRDRWQERIITKTLPVIVPQEVTKYVTRTERVEVEIPSEPVTVIRTVEVPAGCPDPLEGAALGGGCVLDLIETGTEKFARGTWNCEATGPGWSIARGPVVSQEVRYESTPPPPTRLPGLISLGLGVTSQPGLRGQVSWYRSNRRLGYFLAADYGDPEVFTSGGDGYFETFEADNLRVAVGVSLRLGKRK